MPTLDLELEMQAAQKRLAALIRAATAMRPLMKGIAQELLSQTEGNFSAQTQQGGAKWPVLALSSQKARARKGHGATAPMLKGRTPNLVRNFTVEFSDQHAAIKNPTGYATIHQFGGKAGRGHKTIIPARPYLPVIHGQSGQRRLTPPMQRAVNALAKAWLQSAARA